MPERNILLVHRANFGAGQAALPKQSFDQLLGTELLSLESGKAVLALNVKSEFLKQHGFAHGGVIGS